MPGRTPSDSAPLVLVIDDVEDNRDVYEQFLRHEGWRIRPDLIQRTVDHLGLSPPGQEELQAPVESTGREHQRRIRL